MQRSGQDSVHIISTPEEDEGDDEDDEEEDEEEEEDQPEYPTTAFSQGEGHGEIQPAEGHQLGWQGGYPPQWPGSLTYRKIWRDRVSYST